MMRSDLGGNGVGLPVCAMVQVVELANAGVAGFQRLGVGQGGDGPHPARVQLQGKAVHRLAPGPETVAALPPPFRQPGKAALKGVAVQVGHPGD